uniref:Uncharacterized protein n=1 Tax=Romanomermis culicivorax TaxID=13658 RepID=A0A915L3Q3_ROMCU
MKPAPGLDRTVFDQAPSFQFLPQHFSFAARFGQHAARAAILLNAPGHVGHNSFDRSIRHVLVNGEAGLTQRERHLVAHAVQLTETTDVLLRTDAVRTHDVQHVAYSVFVLMTTESSSERSGIKDSTLPVRKLTILNILANLNF